MKLLWSLVRRTLREFADDAAMRLAAAMAFYTVLSLAPAVAFTMLLVSTLWDETAARAQLIRDAQALIGSEGAAVLEAVVERARRPGGEGPGGLFALVMLVLGATAAFGELQQAMNTIWNVQPAPGAGLRLFVRKRLLALAMLVLAAALMCGSLVFSWVSSAALRSLVDGIPQQAAFWRAVNLGASLLLFTLLFALLFKFLPDAQVRWRHAWLGGGVTAVLFAAGRELIAALLSRSAAPSAYGAAGSLVALLLWLYYSNVIFFLGAEFTQVLARHFGRVAPDPDAVSAGRKP
jgi:membrane protein